MSAESPKLMSVEAWVVDSASEAADVYDVNREKKARVANDTSG